MNKSLRIRRPKLRRFLLSFASTPAASLAVAATMVLACLAVALSLATGPAQ